MSNNSSNSKQSGFSLLGLLVIIVTIVVVGAAGWFVYQHNKTKPADAATSSDEQTTTQQKTKQDTDTTKPAQTVGYLDIKEWGVKLPLTEPIKDAYYVVPLGIAPDPDGEPSGAYFGVASLEANCGIVRASDVHIGDSAIGGITRVPPGYVDPISGQIFSKEYPGGITVGTYYYAYSGAIDGKTCAPPSTLQSIDSAFVSAANDITPIDTKDE